MVKYKNTSFMTINISVSFEAKQVLSQNYNSEPENYVKIICKSCALHSVQDVYGLILVVDSTDRDTIYEANLELLDLLGTLRARNKSPLFWYLPINRTLSLVKNNTGRRSSTWIC